MDEKYKAAFGGVVPSEGSVERILAMTKSKRKVSFRPFLIAAVIIALSLVSLVTVNAATDGSVVEKLEEAVQSVRVFIDGKEKSPDDVEYDYSKKVVDGKEVDHYGFKLDDGDYVEFDVESDGRWAAVLHAGDAVVGEEDGTQHQFKAQVSNGNGEIELNAPTTAVLGDE